MKKPRKRKKTRKKQKQTRKKQVVVFVVVLLIVLLLGGGYIYKINFGCLRQNPCEDCDVVLLCPKFEEVSVDEQFFSFSIKNQRDKEGVCFIKILIENDAATAYNKTIKLGSVPTNRVKNFRVPLLWPIGLSNASIESFCEW